MSHQLLEHGTSSRGAGSEKSQDGGELLASPAPPQLCKDGVCGKERKYTCELERLSLPPEWRGRRRKGRGGGSNVAAGSGGVTM